jgi:hypothetical protein
VASLHFWRSYRRYHPPAAEVCAALFYGHSDSDEDLPGDFPGP